MNKTKYIYNKKKHIFLTFLLVCVLCFSVGCNEDHLKGTPFDNTSESNDAGNASNDSVSDKASSSDANGTANDSKGAGNGNGGSGKADDGFGNNTSNNKGSNDGSSNTNENNASSNTNNDGSSSNNDAGSDSGNNSSDGNNESTDITDTGTVNDNNGVDNGTGNPNDGSGINNNPDNGSGNGSQVGLDRNDYWEKTFLIWLPVFAGGRLDNIDYAGTYDYATFNDVSADDIKTYVSELKSSGFTNISIENYSNDAIAFVATNSNSWEVRVTFTSGTLVLGSGFNDGGNALDDKADSLYSSTMLQYVPKFQNGTYVSSETRSDSSMYSSIVYTDVSKEDALSYIDSVKQKGYIYVEDEGESDGTIWYMAINEDKFECHVEFSGSELKIGCGYLEED